MRLVIDEKFDNVLGYHALCWSHVVSGVREDTRLEDDGKVGRCHEILVRVARKDAEKVEKVQEEVLILARHFAYETLVFAYLLLCRVVRDLSGAECVVELKRNDRFRHLGEVASENRGDVVGRVGRGVPVEVNTVLRRE